MPHEVTCNLNNDTARDDELSNSFVSNFCDSNHHLHSLYNQKNHHEFHYSHSNRGANVAQPIQICCPMLPPLHIEPMANVNHHLDHQSNHINPQMHSSTNPLFQNAAKTQPITQQPQQSCHHSKTPVEKAQAAIARL